MNADTFPELPSELKSFEAELVALAPSSGKLRRDELLYRAGWEACAADAARVNLGRNRPAAAAGTGWLRPLTTAGLVLLSATLGIVLATRPPEERVVFVEKPAPSAINGAGQKETAPASNRVQESPPHELAAASESPVRPRAELNRAAMRAGNDYLSLRERVLAYGVEVLPSISAEASNGASTPVRDSRYGVLMQQLRGG